MIDSFILILFYYQKVLWYNCITFFKLIDLIWFLQVPKIIWDPCSLMTFPGLDLRIATLRKYCTKRGTRTKLTGLDRKEKTTKNPMTGIIQTHDMSSLLNARTFPSNFSITCTLPRSSKIQRTSLTHSSWWREKNKEYQGKLQNYHRRWIRVQYWVGRVSSHYRDLYQT